MIASWFRVKYLASYKKLWLTTTLTQIGGVFKIIYFPLEVTQKTFGLLRNFILIFVAETQAILDVTLVFFIT